MDSLVQARGLVRKGRDSKPGGVHLMEQPRSIRCTPPVQVLCNILGICSCQSCMFSGAPDRQQVCEAR